MRGEFSSQEHADQLLSARLLNHIKPNGFNVPFFAQAFEGALNLASANRQTSVANVHRCFHSLVLVPS